MTLWSGRFQCTFQDNPDTSAQRARLLRPEFLGLDCVSDSGWPFLPASAPPGSNELDARTPKSLSLPLTDFFLGTNRPTTGSHPLTCPQVHSQDLLTLGQPTSGQHASLFADSAALTKSLSLDSPLLSRRIGQSQGCGESPSPNTRAVPAGPKWACWPGGEATVWPRQSWGNADRRPKSPRRPHPVCHSLSCFGLVFFPFPPFNKKCRGF